MKMRWKLILMFVLLDTIILEKTDGATMEPPTESTTEEQSTTNAPQTTTTVQTTTTAGTTTSTDAQSTTGTPTQAPTTSAPPSQNYCGDSSSNGLFLSFGSANGDTRLPPGDDGCYAVPVRTNGYRVPFEGQCFKKFHICRNGLVCLKSRYNNYKVPNHGQTPKSYKNKFCMAPFLMDLDNTNSGDVWFHEYDVTEDCTLKTHEAVIKAQALVANETQESVSNFMPDFLLVVTWHNMPHYEENVNGTATFQMIYVSNGASSYVFNVYQLNGMNITSEDAFIGVIRDGEAVGVFGTAVSDDTYRQADKNLYWENNDCYGAFTYSYTSRDCTNSKLICKRWHSCEKQNVAAYEQNFNSFPQCPCTLGQALTDSTYDFTSATDLSQISPGSAFYINSSSVSFTYGKTCGYRAPTFTFIRGGNGRGSYARKNPKTMGAEYQQQDIYYKEVCCSAGLCNLFFDVTPPSDSCQRTQNAEMGNTAGDPHIGTLDGLSYTFNGLGEYILVENAKENIMIQGRTGIALSDSGATLPATVFTAVAIAGETFWMQVELNSNRTSWAVLAGSSKADEEHVDLSLDFYADGNQFNKVLSWITLSRSNQSLIARLPDAGAMAIITNANGVLQLLFSLEKTRYQTFTSGLLGNFNDNKNDDLIPRNSATAIPPTSSAEAIYNNFGETWVTTAAESVFYYKPGESHDTYRDPDFTPNFGDFTEAQLADARLVCDADNQPCIYDYIVSNNTKLATNTLEAFKDYDQKRTIAENQVPVFSVLSGATEISGNYYVYATVNAESTIQVKATDDGTVTTALSSDIAGIQSTNNADESVIEAFTLTDLNPVTLSFTATDNLQEVTQLDINVVACSGCSSHGTCDFTNFLETTETNDQFNVALCTCEPYWTGDNCETDVDGCETSPCFEGQTCNDTSAEVNKADPTLPAFTCSPCPSGFVLNGDKCEDVNECSNAPCTDGTCVNTRGSFECECPSGYRLSADLVTCKDINECDESTHNCDQVCENIAGSYTCSCNTGFKRNDGNTACEIDPADTDVPQKCTAAGCDSADGCTVDEGGTAVCFCNNGYTLVNETSCSDTNECNLGLCSQDCTNTEGSYTCSCYTGFVLDADKVTCNACTFPFYGVNCAKSITHCHSQRARYDPVRGCVCNVGWEGSVCDNDVNECLDTNICGDVDKVCTNTRGSYACTCREGFKEEIDGTCTDIDECADIATHSCEQTCTNTIGSYTCGCEVGYNVDTNDDTKCADIDECAVGISGCEQMCVNLIGRFNCECESGFELNVDRRTCVKLEDVCKAFTTTTCSDICTVVNNAPVCSCPTGYVLGIDNQTCIDVNECDENGLNLCSVKSSCVNTVGGYTCSCEAGFKLENDQRTCTACNEFTYGVNCANNCNCGSGASSCNAVTGCVCKTGWTGENCDADKDECQESPCTAANQICVNTPGSYECRCSSGYNDVNGNCSNIDECADSTLHTCSQLCNDEEGSFSCSCYPGFVQDGNNCNDINECEGAHGCEQICTNVVGSYRCSCPDNYQLNDDKRTCSATNACTDANHCSGEALCARVGGADTCTCKTGYILDTGSTTNCVDVKECSDSNLNGCNQECIESPGNFSCACDQDGFKLDVNQQTCIECEDGAFGDDCAGTCACEISNGNTKSCNKVNGTCTCNPGWEGETCATNVDECNTVARPCPENSACVDNVGSYTCVCSIGYVRSGDGTCSECDSIHYGVNCGETCSCVAANTEECNKVNGECACANGWTGTTCSDNINECLTVNICNDVLKTCTDTDGSYMCPCITGYTLDTNDVCIDNNECLIGTHTCNEVGQLCKNVAPGFTCVCSPGYSGTGSTCTPCSNGTWGDQCDNTCNCNATNTESCDPAVGCVCKQGWSGSDCSQDIDECAVEADNCVTHSVCTNNAGSFTCPCAVGYASSNSLCVACSNNGYGASCGTPCDCEDPNAVTPTQSCNRITGRCECKATWQGSRCESDVDECTADTTLCTDKANQGCHNLNGSYECSCFVGYRRNQQGICVLIFEATTAPVPAGSRGIDMRVKLNFSVDAVSASHNLTVSRTNLQYLTEASSKLKSYFEGEMDSNNFQSLQVYAVTEYTDGLEISYKVVIADTDAAKQDFAKAANDILTTNINIFDQNTAVQELRVGNTTVNPQVDSEKYIKCISYNEANGQCQSDEECVIEDSVPVCRLKPTTDNFGMILGLGLGIPLFLIAVSIIALCVLYLARRRRRRRRRRHGYRSNDFDRSGFFPTTMPTKINTLGRHDPVYVPYSWDDESTVTTSSVDDTFKRRRRRRRGETYPDIAPSELHGDRNFSWDFMYNYLDPDEKYEIQRPRIDPSGHL